MNTIDIDTMLEAYLECALWSSTHFENEMDGQGTPFDEVDAEFHPDALESMRAECSDFLEFLEREGIEIGDALDDSQLGHDFWLTRNGHGTGFWDRGIGELGDKLTKAAETYGSSDLYLGDDGMIHVC